jgi:hypothetical protein
MAKGSSENCIVKFDMRLLIQMVKTYAILSAVVLFCSLGMVPFAILPAKYEISPNPNQQDILLNF